MPAALKLDAGESEVVSVEAAAFAQAVRDPTARQRFDDLSAGAAAGEISDELVATLQGMLELIFEKGRPSNRAVLQAVYARTPHGKQQTAAAREVNRALRTLRGQRLENLRVSAAPGGHTLVLETDRVRLTLEVDRAGARVSSLETG